jgi:MFS family permease
MVLLSLLPAALVVLVLALGARDLAVKGQRPAPRLALAGLGRPFIVFLLINGLFDLGNSSDAFLVLRAQERGLSVTGILGMLVVFNLIYTLVSTPAGNLSDRVGRRRLIIGGWLVYAFIYLGFALAQAGWHIWLLYVAYGLYYGLAFGAAKAMVADLVPAALSGTAYGTYNAVLGLLDLPASLLAGLLWQGAGRWPGFGPAAPFAFGAACALLAALLLSAWRPPAASPSSTENPNT